jgi:hypothetical protein
LILLITDQTSVRAMEGSRVEATVDHLREGVSGQPKAMPQVWTVDYCSEALVMGRSGDDTLPLSRELWPMLQGYLGYNHSLT